MPKKINSVEKSLDILSCFSFEHRTISAQTFSEHLGIPLSTTYRYLETLKQKGFLARSSIASNYELGLKLFKLGNIVSSQMNLGEIALPHMKSLSFLSGETILLVALNGLKAICLEQVEPQKLIRLSFKRGKSLPLYAGAASKLLLAYQENSHIDLFLKKVPLVRLMRNTITNSAQLRKELNTIRREGYSYSDQEIDLDARAVAAGIFDHTGKIVASLCIAGPRNRINEKNREKLIQLVNETAQKVSEDLGYVEENIRNS